MTTFKEQTTFFQILSCSFPIASIDFLGSVNQSVQSASLAELLSLPTGLASNLRNQGHACGEAKARDEL